MISGMPKVVEQLKKLHATQADQMAICSWANTPIGYHPSLTERQWKLVQQLATNLGWPQPVQRH